MRSINKVILIGNLTRDPEVRQTANGQIVTTFGLATNREWMTRDGEHHTSSEFHEVVAWSHLAEICSKFLKKGKLVYIEGYLKTRSWDTPEGTRKFKTEIVVQDMIMLEKRPKDNDINGEYIPDEGGIAMGGENGGAEQTESTDALQNHETQATKIVRAYGASAEESGFTGSGALNLKKKAHGEGTGQARTRGLPEGSFQKNSAKQTKNLASPVLSAAELTKEPVGQVTQEKINIDDDLGL